MWYSIIALGRQTRSNDFGNGMTSSPLDSTHGRIIAFGLAHTVGRRRVWHAIRSFGRQTRSNDVGRGMPSPPLSSSHGRTTSGVACYHGLWTAHTVEQRRAWAYKVERRRAWHAIIALGRQPQSNDVGHGMPSSPLGSTHGRTTSGMACHHCL